MIPWLERLDPFPPVERALQEPNGLLAAGGDLSPGRLLDAYARGIFPWFGEGDPLLWWSPDPRMVLFLREIHVSRSLRRVIAARRFEVTFDRAFVDVMRACAEPRRDEPGTWITDDMVEAYTRLHRLGFAHSVEAWSDGVLAGGLYGVALGRMFYGESMFTRASNASKVALVVLVRHLERWGFNLIDCQMPTTHLTSLGAREIPRAEFLARVRVLTAAPPVPSPWTVDPGLYDRK